jgi:ligand-binding sensor domain-containing protein
VRHTRKPKMEILIKMIYLILILSLNFSCVENKSNQLKTDNLELVTTLKADTLKFTSGISSIIQDSNGNYWVGSLQEGVAVYNSKTFVYFSSKDGLTDNQIHSIQEDKAGVIWFNTQKVVSSYDGTRIKNYS